MKVPSTTKGFLLVIDAGLVERFHRQVAPAPAENNSQSQHLSLMKMAASSSPSSLHLILLLSHLLLFVSPLRNPECHSFYFSISSPYPPLLLRLHQHMYYLDFFFVIFFVLFFMLNLNFIKQIKTHKHMKKRVNTTWIGDLKTQRLGFFRVLSPCFLKERVLYCLGNPVYCCHRCI